MVGGASPRRTRPCSVVIVHFVIMGCGRVGASLAHSIESNGHSVAVIDENPDAFRRLRTSFEGQRVTGIGFDQDTLVRAGIREAYALAAVSNGDNSNILAARVARETFGVSHVVARIYDARRAEVYQRLGVPTVPTVRWTADQVLRRMLPHGAGGEFREPSGRLILAEVPLHAGWVGHALGDVETATGARIAYVTRLGEGRLPTPRMIVQDGDLVHLMMQAEQVGETERILAQPPVEGER